MAHQEIRLTQEGYKKTQDELDYLLTVKRGEIAEKIEVARSFGDLSENSEYDEAKNEQAIVESRIAELDAILKRAVIIDPSEQSTEYVYLGSKVKVHDCEFDEDVVYQIIGSKEADPFQGKLSDESPVGAALLGHRVGEVIDVETPDGVNQFIILEITR